MAKERKPLRYFARWATDQERLARHGENGVVVDRFTHDLVCFAGTMATTQRIATGLNFLETFRDRDDLYARCEEVWGGNV